MKQMKKVLSLLLCFAMLCSMALFLARRHPQTDRQSTGSQRGMEAS